MKCCLMCILIAKYFSFIKENYAGFGYSFSSGFDIVFGLELIITDHCVRL